MLCEEKFEVFENGFEDGKFNFRIEYYGKDVRRFFFVVICEFYFFDYGEDYVYFFECVKEFWGIYMDVLEICGEEFCFVFVKFFN